MRITSRAGLTVELPDDEYRGKEQTLTLAGRIYKARRWVAQLPCRGSLLRVMENVNAARGDLGLPTRSLAVADDPCRDLEDVTQSDIDHISMIAAWCPNWQITAPPTWGMH